MAVRAVPQPQTALLTESNRGGEVGASCLWRAHCLDDGADVGEAEAVEEGKGAEDTGRVGRNRVSACASICTVFRQAWCPRTALVGVDIDRLN